MEVGVWIVVAALGAARLLIVAGGVVLTLVSLRRQSGRPRVPIDGGADDSPPDERVTTRPR